jgi:branched-chain amino acid transport system substrate-binding protein
MQTFISDIHAIGLPIAQNLTLTAAFYWDLDNQTRTWSKRFGELSNGRIGPGWRIQRRSSFPEGRRQGGDDGRCRRGSGDARDSVDDMMTHNAVIRDDGWVMRDLYLSPSAVGLLQTFVEDRCAKSRRN